MNSNQAALDRRQFVSAVSAGVAGAAVAVDSTSAVADGATVTNGGGGPRPSKKVLLIVGENFEELEFSAITGVLSWTRAYSFEGTPIAVTVAGFDKLIGGMGSMRIVPDVLVADLKDADVERFDAVAIPCSVGSGRGRRTGRGQAALESRPVLNIVRRVHARGGVIATMCCSSETVLKAGLLKPEDVQCQYWAEKKKQPAGEQAVPIVVANRIITTMGPAVSWQAVVVLVELLLGLEQAANFAKTCPWVFGQNDELVLKVPIHRATGAK